MGGGAKIRRKGIEWRSRGHKTFKSHASFRSKEMANLEDIPSKRHVHWY